MLVFLIHLSIENSLCNSISRYRFHGVLQVNENHKENDYCGLWEGGERFFILSPLRSNGTIIRLYASARTLSDDLIPDLSIYDNRETPIAKFTKSVVSVYTHVPENQSMFIAGINIPLFSCIRGISFSTKRKGSWTPKQNKECLIILPGYNYDIRLKETINESEIIVYDKVFSKPNMTLRGNTSWFSFSQQPIVFEFQEKGTVEWRSNGFGEGHVEAEGNAADQLLQ